MAGRKGLGIFCLSLSFGLTGLASIVNWTWAPCFATFFSGAVLFVVPSCLTHRTLLVLGFSCSFFRQLLCRVRFYDRLFLLKTMNNSFNFPVLFFRFGRWRKRYFFYLPSSLIGNFFYNRRLHVVFPCVGFVFLTWSQ